MTMGVPTDAASGVCHVIMKWPILGLAVCMASGSYAASHLIPAHLLGGKPSIVEQCGGDKAILIDIEKVEQDVSIGECLEEYDPLALAELRERCMRPEAKDEEICLQI